jgi:hypothetical protein
VCDSLQMPRRARWACRWLTPGYKEGGATEDRLKGLRDKLFRACEGYDAGHDFCVQPHPEAASNLCRLVVVTFGTQCTWNPMSWLNSTLFTYRDSVNSRLVPT